MADQPRTLLDKLWDAHVVTDEPDAPAVLYIDLHLVHEVTSPQAFSGLREKGLTVRRPERTVATMDHSTPTNTLSLPINDVLCRDQLLQLQANCEEFGVRLYDFASAERGIVHVVGPEQGFTQPGMTIVCGDSHTATHGAFGALAFGIGTSEVEMVLATQTLLQRPLKTYEVRVDGRGQPPANHREERVAAQAGQGPELHHGHARFALAVYAQAIGIHMAVAL